MPQTIRSAAPEVWGGIECTINRVGDRFYDQLAWSGHYDRLDDLDRIAELGIRTLRYPVPWEHVAPRGLDAADWSSVDRRLERLRELGVNPIVTLVHHGSGPVHTNLLDDGFAPGLAEFARAVARRYPWIRDYTPVNEPLTTARFSGLYGHWYPHKRDMAAFLRCLVNEIAATRGAMAAIRAVRPDARLIQTEDIGKTHGTALLGYQADHENQRRWLSYDLLFGLVDRDHPLRNLLRVSGIDEGELDAFVNEPCPPDVVGVNYYVTSERWLDERLDLFPPHTHGGNGIHAYADVEALRAGGVETVGLDGVLREAAARYGGPLAVTEVHLGATREDQVRWLVEAWESIRAVRDDGIDVRALTVWSLLGSHNWINLVTRDIGHYEPGVFDVRGGALRPTALAAVVRDLAEAGAHDGPMLRSPGWWRRADRFFYGEVPAVRDVLSPPETQPVLIVAATTDHRAALLARRLHARGLAAGIATPRELDASEAAAGSAEPWAVVVLDRAGGGERAAAERFLDRLPPVPCLLLSTGSAAPRDGMLFVAIGRSGEAALDDDSAGLVDDLIDLLMDGATGRWVVTDDGELRVVATPAERPLGPLTVPGDVAGVINAQSRLDGAADFR